MGKLSFLIVLILMLIGIYDII